MNDNNARINYLTSLLGSAEAELEQANKRCEELLAVLRDVLSMHSMPDNFYRDMTGAMKRARAALAQEEAA